MQADELSEALSSSGRLWIPAYGGLGNQLFGYAFASYCQGIMDVSTSIVQMRHFMGNETHGESVARAFKENWPMPIVQEDLVKSFFLRSARFGSRVLSKPVSVGRLRFAFEGEDPERQVQQISRGLTFISGYFQSQIYLDALQKLGVMKELEPRVISQEGLSLLTEAKQSGSTVMHVRRGDYRNSGINAALPMRYFLQALASLEFRKGATLIVLSDEPMIVFNELRAHGIRNLIVPGVTSKSLQAAEAFYLASWANNLIMSNSTFSWWAARTGRGDKNVIVPTDWRPELVRDQWSKVNLT